MLCFTSREGASRGAGLFIVSSEHSYCEETCELQKKQVLHSDVYFQCVAVKCDH